jgi:hypothetical protein
MELWKPGQGIVLREVWRHKVYSIIPVRVIQDTLHWSALYLPPHTSSLWPHTPEGVTIRIPVEEWILDGGPWEGGDVLYLLQPGVGYMVTGVWDLDHVLDHWKIDLIEPMRRTALGFDYMDQLLDVIVSADRADWRWKDRDEVQEAEEQGLFTTEQVNDLYERGKRALRAFRSYESPFDESWQHWGPDSDWQTPFDLPEGWERV